MPLITVTAGTPVLPANTYNATLIGIAPKKLHTKFSVGDAEDDFLEWTWLVEGPEQDVEITSLTSTATGPKSAIVRYLTALVGAGQFDIGSGFEESDLVGKKAQVTIIEKDGFSKIDNIVAPVVSARRTAAAAPAAAPAPVKAPVPPVPADLEDDLPF